MPRRPERRSRLRLASTSALATAAALVLVACTPSPEGSPSSAPPSSGAAGTPSPSESPVAPPQLVADGTAADNLPLFTSVMNAVWATPDSVSGRAYIDALVAAGFDKAAMQVTEDTSTVGNAAESIQFSVRWGGECLVGQVGPATGTPLAVVLPGLAEGGCLVATTRTIDW